MPEFRIINGKFHYGDSPEVKAAELMLESSRKREAMLKSPIFKYFTKLCSARNLPNVPFCKLTRDKRGVFILDSGSVMSLPSDQEKHGKLESASYHEKAWPSRIGIADENGELVHGDCRGVGLTVFIQRVFALSVVLTVFKIVTHAALDFSRRE